MKRIDADWLKTTATQSVFRMLAHRGYEAYAVGGCVRNTLLGVPVTDIDIATSASPTQVLDAAKSVGLKAIPTGFDHGTVTIVSEGTPFEVTTYRQDVKTDGRRAIVSFTDDIRQDARRRDFTMNALYVDASGNLLDPLDGLSDLMVRRVRFIEDADARIREDYLRSLRFFRFYAQYGDPSEGLDADALSAVASNLDGLGGLAAERIGSEMLKILGARDPAPALAGMCASGALTAILPAANPNWIAPLVHLEHEANRQPDAMRRLVVLGGEDPESRFRLSRPDARKHRLIAETVRKGTRLTETSWRFGPDIAWSGALARHALSEHPLPSNLAAMIDYAAAAEFPLKARDLMDNVTGPALGAALKRAETAWIESDFELGEAALIKIALEEG